MPGIELHAHGHASGAVDLGYLIASDVIGQPMAMEERALRQLVESITANRFVLPRDRKTGGRITENGTAIVEVHGLLLNRSPTMTHYASVSFYEVLAEQFRRLATHDDTKRVVLDIHSPGGMVMGIEGCADALAKLADAKPVFAIAHDMACSAAYWLGCVAEELSTTQDGMMGSIGVRAGHVSYANMLERAGIHYVEFGAGLTKTDGSPYHELTAGEAAEERHGIERIYERFVTHVARHRGMSTDRVRETEARCFTGREAVKARLADRVETLEALIERVEKGANKVRRKPTPPKSSAFPAKDGNKTAAPDDADDEPAAGKPTGATSMTIEAADLATAITASMNAMGLRPQATAVQPAASAAPQASRDEVSAAVAAERARIFAVLEHAEANGRLPAAIKLAKAGIAADAAGDILATLPKVEAPKADDAAGAAAGLSDALAREMAKSGNAGGVRPEAETTGARPPLKDRMAASAAKRPARFGSARKG